jgi:Holliday junction resolvasome RuvABC ATP-dependent DNA helicase subunit
MFEESKNPHGVPIAREGGRAEFALSDNQTKLLQAQFITPIEKLEKTRVLWEVAVSDLENRVRRGELPLPTAVRPLGAFRTMEVFPAKPHQFLNAGLISSFFAAMQDWEAKVKKRDSSDYRIEVLTALRERWEVVAAREVTADVYSSFVSELREISDQYPNFLKFGEQCSDTLPSVLQTVEASVDTLALESRLHAHHRAVSDLRKRIDRLCCLTLTSLQQFVGQREIKDHLELATTASRLRKEPLPHILLAGPPGMGKRTLAEVIAFADGSNFVRADVGAIRKGADLIGALTKMQPKSIFFIEDIERIPDAGIKFLVPALTNLAVDITLDRGSKAKAIRMPVAQFTLIATTTRIDRLTDSLMSCFRVTAQFADYSTEELSTIAHRIAAGCGLDITPEALRELVRRSAGTPRGLLGTLRTLRDYATVKPVALPLTSGAVVAALGPITATDGGQERLVIPSTVRREVWRRDGGKCVKCGSRENLEYDHIIPVSRGGSNTARNIELLCEKCNRAKSDCIQ